MTRTEREPLPKSGASSGERWLPDWPQSTELPPAVAEPTVDFMTVLRGRRSAMGEALSTQDLAAVLRHSTALRFTREDGRFGTWESRSAPAAGGLHATSLLCLPFEAGLPGGMYDPASHALLAPDEFAAARELNRASAALLSSATAGTTIQLVVDAGRYAACYQDPESLMLRDAGAICATIALVATALGLTSVILGRLGTDIVRAAGLPERVVGTGAIHLGARA